MPSPSDYKTEGDFISACIQERQHEHPDEDQKQSTAICFSIWSDRSKSMRKKEADKTPYGDVEYADPGFQKDGKKRYPLDTEEHIRAAWGYINHPDNWKLYTTEHVTHIKNAIISAWKRKIHPDGPPGEKSMRTKQMDDNEDMTPHDDETQSEFMDRCRMSGCDDDECSDAWDDYAEEKKMQKVVQKTHIDKSEGMDFILSDATPDRFDDVVVAEGWQLANFKKNPIALFNHDASFVIGKWDNLHVEKAALRGRLKMAPAGTSARIDELRKLVEAGILKAVSVGFRPIEHKPRGSPSTGSMYTKSELVETSLVAIPANPNALAIAKGMKVSAATLNMVFAKHGSQKPIVTRSGHGKHAETSPKRKGETMSSPIAQRIEAKQAKIVSLRDQLTEHLKAVDDDNPTEENTAVTETLTQQIEAQERDLEALKRAETNLMTKAADEPEKKTNGSGGMEVKNYRPFAAPIKKVNPVDYIFRALTVQVKHHNEKGARTMVDVMKETYGECDKTYAMMNIITRTATAPARTDTTGWAQELVTIAIGDFFDLLQPVSIYANLSSKGGRFTFGPNGVIAIPTRSSTPTLAGAFVGQGNPIPVKQGAFTAITLTPKKVGVISTFTREISEHSTPSIEQLIRDAIVADTANAIDAVLMDSNAATAIRPAGLGTGLSTQTANAGTDLAGVIADIKTMTNALFTGTLGNVRSPVWIMPPGYANNISLATLSSTGVMPFRDEIAAGRLAGYPMILSANTAPSDTIWLMDAADFISATGDTPRFDVSDQAVLHLEDTTPLDITTASVGTTVKSLWQTDSIGIRMLLDINWAMRRTGMVYFMTGVNWAP
jgi:HK97 family phage prohead protease/HK97 family phage major capsid protein